MDGGTIRAVNEEDPDTSALVRAAQAGDAAAVERLVEAHLGLVYNVIGRVLNGDTDVDDLVQETMIQAIRGLPALRDPERFRPWLLAIAHRQVQLHLRGRHRAQLRRHPQPVDVPDPGGDLAERTLAELELTRQRADLTRATHWLDPDDRQLLALWWQEVAGDLTRTDLAAALGVTPPHAAVRVRRMKSHLDAVRAVVRALGATPRCPGLAEVTRRWTGATDAVWRKRLVRHVRDCPRCGPFRTGLVAPEKLLLGVVALPVPVAVAAAIHAALHARAVRTVAFGPMVLSHLPALLQKRAVAAATTAAAVIAGGGLVFAVHYSPGSPDEFAAEPPVAVAPSDPAGTGSATASGGAVATPTPRTPEGAGAADIFVAPNGSDAGDGSEQRPYATLNKAVTVVRPGQTIALRGGTYRLTQPVDIRTSGTGNSAAQRITLSNFRNEQAVLDASGIPADKWAVTQQTAYWTVQGLEIRNAPTHAWVCRACRDNVFRRIVSHHNGRSGLMLRDDGTTGNQVLDSDFFDNRDATGTAGIGLGVQFGSGTGNLIRGNRAYGNAAGGYDLGAFRSPVSVEYNWAFGNRANGFTFGGGPDPLEAAHKVRHNAAWVNTGHGFSNDGNRAALELSNNTAFKNRSAGFSLPDIAAVLRLNVAVDNGDAARVGPTARADNNSWQEGDSTAALFRSVDARTAEGPRAADGGLPGTDYLATRNGRGASMSGR
jgi:RNA polymerase sigma factor (sigma-70 family)